MAHGSQGLACWHAASATIYITDTLDHVQALTVHPESGIHSAHTVTVCLSGL